MLKIVQNMSIYHRQTALKVGAMFPAIQQDDAEEKEEVCLSQYFHAVLSMYGTNLRIIFENLF